MRTADAVPGNYCLGASVRGGGAAVAATRRKECYWDPGKCTALGRDAL